METIYRGRNDPLEILLREEAQTCKGCSHRIEAWGQQFCEMGRPSFPRRCRRPAQYQEELRG